MSTPYRDEAALQNQLVGLSHFGYTPENIERANHYLRSRGINPQLLRHPCTMLPHEPMWELAPYIRPQRVQDTLLIPIVSIKNPQKLIAFDCRYLGTEPGPPRYFKIKGAPPEPMIYGIHRVFEVAHKTPVILCEGFADAEAAYNVTGLPAIAYLTTKAVPSVVATLLAITDTVLLALDNDADGIAAANELFNLSLQSKHSSKLFTVINYQGKDPGEVVKPHNPHLPEIFREATKAALELSKLNKLKMDQTDPFAKAVMAPGFESKMLAPAQIVDPFKR